MCGGALRRSGRHDPHRGERRHGQDPDPHRHRGRARGRSASASRRDPGRDLHPGRDRRAPRPDPGHPPVGPACGRARGGWERRGGGGLPGGGAPRRLEPGPRVRPPSGGPAPRSGARGHRSGQRLHHPRLLPAGARRPRLRRRLSLRLRGERRRRRVDCGRGARFLAPAHVRRVEAARRLRGGQRVSSRRPRRLGRAVAREAGPSAPGGRAARHADHGPGSGVEGGPGGVRAGLGGAPGSVSGRSAERKLAQPRQVPRSEDGIRARRDHGPARRPRPLLPEPGLFGRYGAIALADACKRGQALPENPLFAAFDRLEEASAELRAAFDGWLRRARREVLDEAGESVRRRVLEDRRLGYDDLLLELYRALRGEGGERLARRIRREYPVALIDEFQDTDPVQAEVFLRIYGSGGGATGGETGREAGGEGGGSARVATDDGAGGDPRRTPGPGGRGPAGPARAGSSSSAIPSSPSTGSGGRTSSPTSGPATRRTSTALSAATGVPCPPSSRR